MSYEVWTREAYGYQFGQPKNMLHEGLSEQQVAEYLQGDHGKLLHQMLVIKDGEATLANKWLAAYEKRG